MEAFRAYIGKFATLPDPAWEEMREIFSPVPFSRGEAFVRAGQIETRVGFLTNGITRTFYTDQAGKEFNKFFNRPPSFLAAYTSAITKTPSLLTVEALTDCQALVADYHLLDGLTEKYPEVERMIRKLGEFLLIKKEKREYELVMLDAEARYLNFRQDFPGLEQEIAQYHIASFLGITPTQLSRIRAKL